MDRQTEGRHDRRRAAGLAALAAWTCTAVAAGAAEDVVTIEDIARLEVVTEAKISPDGRHSAYVLSVPRDIIHDSDVENGSAWQELHVVDPDGISRPFVSGEVRVNDIEWRPGHREVSFLSKRGDDEHTGLYTISIDGGEARKLVGFDTDISAYSWNPDGERVAFLAKPEKDSEVEKLSDRGFNQVVYEEDWRPVKIWIVAVEDDEAEPKELEVGGSASELHWSPGGDRIAAAIAPTPLVDDRYTSRKVHVFDLQGKVVARVANPGKLGDVSWSPNGRHLAYVSAADAHDPSAGRLMVADAATGEARELYADYPGHFRRVAWGGDDRVLFLGDEGTATRVGEVGLDDSYHKTLLDPSATIFTQMSVTLATHSAVLIGESPEHPAEMFSLTAGDMPFRVTRHNRWLKERQLSPHEVVRYTARDGEEIEGILIPPLGAEEGKRYPLIMVVHGGPESHIRNGWLTSYSRPGQLAAGRGFAVFYPNYRGSTGRGVAFTKQHQGDAAGKEFDDLVDAIDHLVETGLVDGDRVGITGGSYGGYATAWGSTYYSERFAAGVMFVGISNKISKAGTTDIPHEENLVHSRSWPWESWKFYMERSPIYHVEKARTPLLILHGKDDPRVHPGQSMELYRHLKVLGKTPVRLVLYPGEGHGNRKAAARLDYNLRMMRWMEHYLKGPGGDPPPHALDYPLVEEDDAAEAEE